MKGGMKSRGIAGTGAIRIETREVTPALWPQVEALFRPNGACAGCWCMFWRLEKGERFEDVQGAEARRRFREGILSGEIHGVLAFSEGEPIGWCTFGRRTSFARLDRSPSLKCDDAGTVWSVPCFYVKSGYRQAGVATRLLDHAVRAIRRRKGSVVEGYPTLPDRRGRYIPAFSYTGTMSLFSNAGFALAAAREKGKQRVRRRP
jgi:GNAT superfamily N-acetyltransferase